MSTLYLNSGKQDILTKKDYLLSAANSLGLKNVRPIEEVAQSPNPPEYVLNIQPYAKIYRPGTKWTGVWEIDCLINREQMQWWWNQTDTVFLANRVDWLEKVPKKVRYLMQGCLPELYNFEVNQKYDFVQIGTMTDPAYFKDYKLPSSVEKRQIDKFDIYKTRFDIFEKLKAKYNVLVYDKPERLPVKEYLEILSRGKIQFIRSMDVMGEGEIAQRFFESLPMGPVLTNYAQDLDWLNLIPNGDYCIYHDDEEMFQKIDELLGDDALRSDIAKHGREKAFKEQTYGIRLNEILDFLTAHFQFREDKND